MDQFDSPYNAMGNNPVINIDPDGMFSIPWGAILSNVGTALSSVKQSFTSISLPFMTKTTHTYAPFANQGSALNIAGTILSMGMDAKAILDAAGEMDGNKIDNDGRPYLFAPSMSSSVPNIFKFDPERYLYVNTIQDHSRQQACAIYKISQDGTLMMQTFGGIHAQTVVASGNNFFVTNQPEITGSLYKNRSVAEFELE